jgi:hypothetical protein
MRLVLAVFLSVWTITAQERWDAKITLQDKVKVPFSFQFQVAKDGRTASASWGDVRSTGGKVADGKLTLDFAGGSRIEANYDGKTLEGQYIVEGVSYRIEAAPFCTCGFQGEAGPDIAGVWRLSDGGGTLTVRRTGEDTFAELELPDGGRVKHLFGRFDGLSFALAAFDGRRGVLLDAEPDGGDSLKITLQFPGSAVRKFTASKERK